MEVGNVTVIEMLYQKIKKIMQFSVYIHPKYVCIFNYINTHFGISAVDIPCTIFNIFDYFIKIYFILKAIYPSMKFEIRFIIGLLPMSLETVFENAVLNLQPANAMGKLF